MTLKQAVVIIAAAAAAAIIVKQSKDTKGGEDVVLGVEADRGRRNGDSMSGQIIVCVPSRPRGCSIPRSAELRESRLRP